MALTTLFAGKVEIFEPRENPTEDTVSEKKTCPICGLHSSNLYYTGVCTNRCNVPRPDIVEFIELRSIDESADTAELIQRLMGIHQAEETGDTPPLQVCRHDQVAQPAGLYPCATVRAIAATWVHHPDYRQEWAV
ncbi:hypothetical protein ABZ413_29665 [Nocardia rhamnosiphila]|uniref:hypothetical protein n=1 Tax=Nocardia rhamnosiphila TaxID=426716 RepID=UPI0033E347EA